MNAPTKQAALAIPGLPEAAAEAYDTAGALEAQRMGFTLAAPKGEIDTSAILAGPLFRGTDAAPQVELFGKVKP